MKRIFATINVLIAAAVPVLVIIFANTYSESPFMNAPQMFLVMALGLAWALLNALLSVSPIIYFVAWNMFFRTY